MLRPTFTGNRKAMTDTAVWIFLGCTAVVALFQACLAAGLPWGAASMGGKYPGRYPPRLRAVAVANIAVLAFLALVVLSRAGWVLPDLAPYARGGAWVVVGFFALATVMNTITPSKIERIWAPVALVQAITAGIVATG